MIASIAILRGYNVNDDEVKTLIYMCLVGNAIGDVIKNAGIKTAQSIAAKSNRAIAFCLFKLECAGIESVILTLLLNESIVASALDYLALFQNHNGVGVAYSGKSVCHDKGGSSLHKVKECILNLYLSSRIDG